jgi:Ca-activated chloride channel family protein
MTFAWPLALAGLVAIPLLAGVYVLAARRRRRDAGRFANPALVPNLVAASPGWRRYVPPVLALASLALLIVGIARPHVVQDVARDEATIVLTIDVSRSMEAKDVQPTRFQAAKEAALAFLDEVPDEYSVGIVAFSTSADPVLPPTIDREAARTAIAELRLGSGTAIGTAITRSVDLALEQQEGDEPPPQSGDRSPAAVLLLSDGAQTAGDIRPLPAAQRARRLGVPVSTVGLGTSEAVVEVPRPGGLKERVVVAPDLQTLRLVATTTGGTFSEAPSSERLQEVYRELGTRLAHDRKRVEVTSAFAAGGAVLLLLGGALSSLWFRRAL